MNLVDVIILFFLGNYHFSPRIITRLPFAHMNYQFYITFSMNYHFVTEDLLPSVKDIKHDGQRVTCINSTMNSVVDCQNSVVNSIVDRLT
jgi:hypothetical protein